MSKRATSALSRFAGLSISRKLLYAEVTLRLIAAWTLVRAVPFRNWKHLLRQSPQIKQQQVLKADEICFLTDVQHVFRQIKWATRDRATCLMMVLVARWMLNRRGIPGIIFFGVRRDPAKAGLFAHAWLHSAIGVVGHEGVEEFAVVERIGA